MRPLIGLFHEPVGAVVEETDVTREPDGSARCDAREEVHHEILEEEKLRNAAIPEMRVFLDRGPIHNSSRLLVSGGALPRAATPRPRQSPRSRRARTARRDSWRYVDA